MNNHLQVFLQENELPADTIIHLIQQGVEIERLKLEIMRCTESESISTHIKILQGERFAFLLRIGCAC